MIGSVVCGNNIELLKQYPDNHFHAVVTDGPYGLSKAPDMHKVLSAWLEHGYYEVESTAGGFMGKQWDSFVPQPAFWKEVYRVLRPGGHVVNFFGTRTYDMGVLAMRLAGFEIRDQLQWLFGCYSSDTECLTKRGWITYDQINLNDFVLQWNPETEKLSWCHPEEIYKYETDDELVSICNRNTDQLVTKNHTVYAKIKTHARNKKPVKFESRQAVELKNNWIIDLPLASVLNEGIPVKWPYLIGWWLTDAWLHGDGKACMFSQSKKRTVEKLRSYLNKINAKFSEYKKIAKKQTHNDEITFYVTGEVSKYLIENFIERKLTYDFLHWDYESRMQLFEGLMDGDGSIKDGQYSYAFWSKDKERLDMFQSLCMTLNFRSHIDYKKGCVYLNVKRNTSQLQYQHARKLKKYNGIVWCLKTQTGAFCVRRSGKAFISGNSGFPKSLNVARAIDEHLGVEPTVVEKKKGGKILNHAGQNERPWMENYKDEDGEIKYEVTEATSSEARQWEGWATGLKPANEPVVLARKPLEGTVAENILKWGCGAINIEGCRIDFLSSADEAEAKNKNQHGQFENGSRQNSIYSADELERTDYNASGRFPANLILDNEAAGLLDKQSGESKSTGGKNFGTLGKNIYGTYNLNKQGQGAGGYGDIGGASRFFKIVEGDEVKFQYVAKASREERNRGLDPNTFVKQVGHSISDRCENCGLRIMTFDTDTNRCVCKNPKRINKVIKGNYHPTVKPVDIMQWLIRLVTPKDGILLDPFAGSGTTGCAAEMEKIKYVLIDQETDYVAMATARCKWWNEYQYNLNDRQGSLFDQIQ